MKVLVRPTPVRENRLARRRSQSGGAWPGGDLDRVAHWLQEAAPVAGYVRVRDRADHTGSTPCGSTSPGGSNKTRRSNRSPPATARWSTY